MPRFFYGYFLLYDGFSVKKSSLELQS